MTSYIIHHIYTDMRQIKRTKKHIVQRLPADRYTVIRTDLFFFATINHAEPFPVSFCTTPPLSSGYEGLPDDIMSMKMMQIICFGLHRRRISTLMNTYGRIWTEGLDRVVTTIIQRRRFSYMPPIQIQMQYLYQAKVY